MAVQDLKYKELTGKIIGCAMKVHRYFGPGFPEIVYHRALKSELAKIGLKFKSEFEKDIYYEEVLISKRRLDLLVEDLVLVELKAVKELDSGDQFQIINYLRVFKIEVGLLLNFGSKSLQYKRYIRTEQSNP
jgi:GxxExxY protein